MVDVEVCDIERDSSDLPQTVLYFNGEEKGAVSGGDISEVVELFEKGKSGF